VGHDVVQFSCDPGTLLGNDLEHPGLPFGALVGERRSESPSTLLALPEAARGSPRSHQ
jgi:hypothetical protein